MSRWFKVDYRPSDSQHVFTCEVACHKMDDEWHVVCCGMERGAPVDNLWWAIGNLLNANNLHCVAMHEIDRAGSRIA